MKNDKSSKTKRVLGCLGVLIVVVGVSYLVLSSNTAAPQPATADPRPGFWSGTGVWFTLTRDGKIEDFVLAPAEVGVQNAYCGVGSVQFRPTLHAGRLLDDRYENQVDGFYAADGKFHGTYTLALCGQWRISPIEKGTWTAGWVSDEIPSP